MPTFPTTSLFITDNKAANGAAVLKNGVGDTGFGIAPARFEDPGYVMENMFSSDRYRMWKFGPASGLTAADYMVDISNITGSPNVFGVANLIDPQDQIASIAVSYWVGGIYKPINAPTALTTISKDSGNLTRTKNFLAYLGTSGDIHGIYRFDLGTVDPSAGAMGWGKLVIGTAVDLGVSYDIGSRQSDRDTLVRTLTASGLPAADQVLSTRRFFSLDFASSDATRMASIQALFDFKGSFVYIDGLASRFYEVIIKDGQMDRVHVWSALDSVTLELEQLP